MVQDRRKGAKMAQWAIYLALSTFIGVVWSILGFAALLATWGGDGQTWLSLLPPFLLASFFAGVTYRLFAMVNGKPPSPWFAVVIPGLGAISYQIFLVFDSSGPLHLESYLDGLFPMLMYAYVCGGIVLIPLAIPHAMALQWLHLKQEAWAMHASRRAIRQTGYGVVCVGLLLFSEGRAAYQSQLQHRVEIVSSDFGISMPPGTVLIGQNDVTEDDYHRTVSAYFRVEGGIKWPPKEGTTPLSQEENHRDVRARMGEYTKAEITRDSKLDQVKWFDPAGWTQASRLRTPQADFVELIRNQ